MICLDPSRGLLVNDKSVDIAKYLESDRGHDAVAKTWNLYQELDNRFQFPLRVFRLPNYNQAFETAVSNPSSSVLTHRNSGINSPKAQGTCNSTNYPSSNTSLEVITDDATDRPSMTTILHQIHKKTPIKGVVNMAMILGDAPLASITGAAWDLPLRVKVDSS